MNTKGIVAIAILGILFASTFALIPAPVVSAADNWLFDLTIIAPGNANLLRRQWGLIIANSFKAVGINANVVFLDWGSCYDRCLTPAPENIGKTWSQGGYDVLEIGWTPGNPALPYAGSFQIYYGPNTPPAANYFLWDNPVADAAIEGALTKGYTPAGIADFKAWQAQQYNDVPASQIFFQSAVFTAANNVDFNGFEWIFDNIGTTPQFVQGVTSFTLGTTGELLDLVAPLSNSWYDTIVFAPVYDGLYFLDNDFTYKPAVAIADPVVSTDGREYTYTLRSGVTFHDGHELDADDVVFTWLAYLNPATGSQQSAFTAGYIGDDVTFKWMNGTETRIVLDLNAGTGAYPATNETGTRIGSVEAVDAHTVKVTIADFGDLGKPAATFHPEGEVGVILPMHLMSQVAWEDWKASTFNTGTGTLTLGSYTVKGPVGCGPYVFEGYNPTSALVTETKYTGYWNKTGLESIGYFGVNTFYVRYIVEKDAAIAALKNSEVQAIDQNYQLQRDYTTGNLNFATSYVLEGSGLQQLGYNMRSPIWGTGTATPNRITDPANAANYARYVRQAFDYLIPRQLIIDNILSGLGTPGAVHVSPISPLLNPACPPREYNPTMAKQLLAQAGYDTGVTPPGPSVSGNYLVNEPLVFTGTFPVDVVASSNEGGMVVRLWESADNSTFTPVAQTISTTGGYYQLVYTPTVNGTRYYKVDMPGIGARTAAFSAATGPDFPYDGLTRVMDPQSTAAVAAQIKTTTDITAPLQATINTQQSQINALNASLSSLSTIAYVGVVLAIVALLVGIVAFMRKK